MQALSPQGVLARGYTYCADAETGELVPRAEATHEQQRLNIHFADGVAPAHVDGPWTRTTTQQEQST